jgi:Na+-transporting NADH:ubiquinone oxidoreductase subunit A
MKLIGGHMPKIAGRPAGTIEDVPVPGRLFVSLGRNGISYVTAVKDGKKVKFGDPLAEASVAGGKLVLPAPAAGKVILQKGDEEQSGTIIIEGSEMDTATSVYERLEPQRAPGEKIRNALAHGGVLPFFWSSQTGGVPSLEGNDRPKAIIVNSVLTEPFRTRGKILWQRSWDRIVAGMKFFPRLMTAYGTTEVILTDKRDPVARKLYSELAGFAWLHIHPVPLLYPAENPRILDKALRRHNPSIKKNDVVWVIDIQGVEAVGACLADGYPAYQRIVALGGPGHPDPVHVSVRVGIPIKDLMPKNYSPEEVLVLRGGVLKGEPVDPEKDAVNYDDDAFFFLPRMRERQFISFMRPGFHRTSAVPCFASRITGASDREISNSLRGERRPCIACGLCEKVCPAYLLPQVIHRYLYREAYDQAEAVGLDLCVDCGLCTYVCPSKIELQEQFNEARRQLILEHEEAGASES